MEIQTVKISSVLIDPANVRTHAQKNIAAIKASLARFGQQKPIVVDDAGIVRAGNGTLRAAIELGWSEIKIVRTGLAGVEATAFAIADNRSAELAGWDFESLSSILISLQSEEFPILELGWDQHELDPLLQADWKPSAPSGENFSRDLATSIMLTEQQREIIDRAIQKIRAAQGDPGMPEGRCLEIICGDYLA